ncbi:MAG: DUF2272 domain-containing protein [Burkholderiales bacterium]|nr:DUF2272 domain-containing protein [Burkholderiales bacterium]
MTSIVPKLIEVCEEEWNFFERSVIRLDGTTKVGKKEYEDGAWQRIGDYWTFIGGAYKNLTGKDRGTAWSAAFISWCMNEAGAGNNFPYSAGHAKYINQAIRNSNNSAADAPIVGHRLKDYQLKVGDLIGYWRGDTKITFDNARQVGWYGSHTDIVVEIGDGVAFVIGGNVLHSVTKRAVKIGPNGTLTDKSQNWFVAIQNNM